MEFLAGIPGVISAYVALTKSPERAFLDVYLPVVLILPDYYRWVLPGLPDPTFSEAAILPIAAIFFIKHRPTWKFSVTDFIVLGYAACVGYSEYLNAGYADAQNLMFDMSASVVLPYALAKTMIEPLGLRVQFAKRMVFLLFIVSMISVFEF